MNSLPAPTSPLQAAVILFDIVDYSKLDDRDQYQAIHVLTESLRAHLDSLSCQAELDANRILLGMLPTGDGLYLVVREEYAGYGLLLALSLRSLILDVQRQVPQLIRGVRTAVHIGTVIPLDDINGARNFVGSGLNDCARCCGVAPSAAQLQEVDCSDGNWLLASATAISALDAALAFPAAQTYLKAIDFRLGARFEFADKHGKKHVVALCEAVRYLDGPPPALPDLPPLRPAS